jgi:adenylate cyclase
MPNLIARIRRFAAGRGRIPGAILLLVLLALQFVNPPLLDALRLRAFDVLQRLEPRVETNFPVIIVDIDEKSLAEQGQWPWPRNRLGDLVQKLMVAGAVVIGFDMVFAEPDRTSPSAIADELMSVSPDIASGLFSLPDHDTEFASVLKRARVVLGEVAVESGGVRTKPVSAIARIGGNPLPYMPSFTGFVANIPVLAAAASGRGNFGLIPDVDGIIRRVPAVMRIASDIHPSLGIEILRVATGGRAIAVKMDPAGIASVVVAGRDIITDKSGQIWIRFGNSSPRRYISATDILDGNFDANRIKNRIVLIGASAAGLRDIRATPVDRSMPGTEVHAQMLETILEGSYLRRSSWSQITEVLVVAAVGILLLVLVPFLGARWTILLPIGVAAAMPLSSWYLFKTDGYLIDATYPTLATAVIYLVLVYFGQVAEERRRKAVSRNFAQYLSPAVVERLARDPNPPKLGGEQRDMTVMFVDIAGFTTLSERFKGDPEGLTHLINRFLTAMSREVRDREGTLDKYIGDAMMAFWNAPMNIPDHAARACAGALAMVDGLAALNNELAAEAMPVKGTGATGAAPEAMSRLERLESDARSGIAQAQYQLAKIYRDGAGVEKSVEAALRWLRAAADQGDARAQRNLGLRYARGNGVPQDDREALFWLNLAQRQLDTVTEDRDAAQYRLNSADVEAVKARVATWTPAPIGSRAIRLEMGIGLNTGLCLVGNLGSKYLFNYSVMGDPVNLASRLEAQTRTYGVDIIVSETTRAAAPGFAFLELDLIAVKGKTEAVRIFALLGSEAVAQTDRFHRLVETQGRFLSAYRAQRWAEARDLIKASRGLWDGLGELYDLYARRITIFEDDPPGPDWNGVYVAHTK